MSTTTRPGQRIRPDPRAADELATSLRGELVRPGDGTYELHRRVWNGSVDRHPALIARCAGVADVVAALQFARAHDLLVAVRGGGHSFPGYSVCDGGIVVDLRPMNGIRVDPDARTVRARGGVLLGELDRVTQELGLAVPTGAVTHTGLAGLTLGGGIGWLMRRHGLTIDQLLAVHLVTADGERVTADADRNPDLFWGVRGGGGNFGVVTHFDFRLQPVGPTVVGGLVLWPLEDGPEVVRFYRDWCATAPDELTTALVLRKAPAIDVVPGELHGRLVVGVACCWAGAPDAGQRVLHPMRTFGAPLLDLCAPRPFVEHQAMLDPSYPHGLWAYLRACDVPTLTDDVVDIALEHAARIDSPRSTVTIWQLGGAVGRVGPGETAFAGRAGGHIFNITGATGSAEGFDGEKAWARAMWSALSPHQRGVYVNFLMDEGEERVRQAYHAGTYERLRALKRRYDPGNVFRRNQNILPA